MRVIVEDDEGGIGGGGAIGAEVVQEGLVVGIVEHGDIPAELFAEVMGRAEAEGAITQGGDLDTAPWVRRRRRRRRNGRRP